MFKWFTKDSVEGYVPVIQLTSTDDCAKDKEIKELQSKLKDNESKFEKLRQEIDQSYIKDTHDIQLNNPHIKFRWLEYIDKLGVETVKYYNGDLNYSYVGYSVNPKLAHTWDKDTCVKLRDFLLKNFPIESKEESNANND